MRILTICGTYAPNRLGGAAVVAEQTAAGLHELGHEVVVATGMPGAAGDLLRWESDGIAVVGVAVASPGRGRRHPDDAVQESMTRLIDVLAPDVLHLHSRRILGQGALDAVLASGRPTLATVYGSDPAPTLQLAAADRLILGDAALRDLLPEDLRSRVQVIPHAVARPTQLRQGRRRRGPLRLGYIGGRDPMQGYTVLLDALQSLGRTDYELQVVDRAALRGRRSLREWDFRVPGLVRIVPGYAPGGRDGFFAGLDVLLDLPQDLAGPGLVAGEAAVRGVLPLTTRTGSAARTLAEAGLALLLTPGSAPTLAAAVDGVLQQPPAPTGSVELAIIPTIADEVRALDACYTELVDGAT